MSRKQEILDFVKVRGQASLGEVADHLGLSKQGALRHLESLQGEGMLDVANGEPSRRGRPEHVFRLTAEAAGRFPQAHRELASDLLEFLGPELQERFFAERSRRLEVEYAGRLAGLDFEGRVRELAKLATEHGHMAEVVSEPDGSLAIRQGHCPIADVAAHSGLPCLHEQAAYRRLLGADAVRTTYIPDSAPACTYVVRGGAAVTTKTTT